MLIDELASLRLFDGLTRDQLAELIAGQAVEKAERAKLVDKHQIVAR